MIEKIREISKKVGQTYGQEYYQKLVLAISEAANCDYVFIAKIDRNKSLSTILAISAHGKLSENFAYELTHTPCKDVVDSKTCIYESGVTNNFPKDKLLVDMGIEAYIGIPLFDSKQQNEGLLVALHGKPIKNADDILLLFELAASRVAVNIERSYQDDEYFKLLNYDKLTGLSSKLAIREKLAEAGERSLLIFSINNFNVMNEAYGIPETDKVIRVLAKILPNIVQADAYGSLGPSKFALLFNTRTSLEQYIHIIRDYFYHNEVKTDSLAMYISFSYGGAIGTDDLIRSASAALRKSQVEGNYQFHISDQTNSPVDFLPRQSFIEASNLVHIALENDLIVPYFQGIRNNITEQINKYEVLARIHYKGQVITPFNFIEAAKYSGALPRVTQMIIEKSFEVMSHYDYEFSVNITEDDLSANFLLEKLTAQCKKYKISTQRVTLEILEGISSSAKEGHLEQIRTFKKAGFKISIDDFGAEYSNFERLLDLEVDFIKIDSRYIKNIEKSNESFEIVKAIAYFCQNTRIKCIAEFVCSQGIQDIIQSLGIGYSQGYLYSEPQPLNEKVPAGTIEITLDENINNLIWMKVHGHYTRDMAIEAKFVEVVQELKCEGELNVIFDSRNSDFFQVSEQDIIEAAKIDSYAEGYKNINKCALLNNDDYAEFITQAWCDNLEDHLTGKVCQSEQEAIDWIIS